MESSIKADNSSKRKSTKPHKSNGVKRRSPSDESEAEETYQQISEISDENCQSLLPTSSECDDLLDNNETKQEWATEEIIQRKRRGRPKGTMKKVLCSSPTKDQSLTGEDSTANRKKGRPKGSKNKYPSWSALQQQAPESSKLGRGRPRKQVKPNVTVTSKRPRGRPKGSLNKASSAKINHSDYHQNLRKVSIINEVQDVLQENFMTFKSKDALQKRWFNLKKIRLSQQHQQIKKRKKQKQMSYPREEYLDDCNGKTAPNTSLSAIANGLHSQMPSHATVHINHQSEIAQVAQVGGRP
ncbi:hypothetical protein GDO86_015585 [Hymenochirus boettgeri]|uniref:Uncharacterized protein n=1 Tax=Hymenochirus boettgeri TaxID=247094 RepID=A0A8T2K1V0_9PIPI|nr:hypothetical protein GDO86_015585 [Hymenochirus boettgeri]